ncbi:zinc ribbon domain-containing protein [bacterium]|nr:zinc ribbon domain-containing protein [bacterium]
MEGYKSETLQSCAKCGHKFKASSLFCPNCGEKRIAQIKPADNTCENCGAEYGEDQKFCTKCGKPLRPLIFCEHCAKNGLPTAMPEGARYCAKCGGAAEDRRIDFRAYQAEVAQRQDLADDQCFMARVIGAYGHGYGSGTYPMLEWNGLLITISAGTIYIYNMLSGKSGGITLRPFCFSGGEYPKVTCPVGIVRSGEGRFPALFRVVNGMLAVPGNDRIFLWNVASNIMRRDREERRGGSKGFELKLNGELIADLSGNEERFLAALVRASEGVQLCVYEFAGDAVNLYASWTVPDVQEGAYSVYVTSHCVYVLVQPDCDTSGDLLCYSLDTYRAVELPQWRGCCRPILSFDNVPELIQCERASGYSEIYQLRDEQSAPVLLLDSTVLPQCCGRDGQAFWIVGRSLLFADGQNNFSVIDGLDESMMRMSVPPVRSLYGLCFIDDKGHLCTVRQSRIAPWKKKLAVYIGSRELHLNRLSPWVANGACMYGFSDEGLIAIDMSSVYRIPAQEQNGADNAV